MLNCESKCTGHAIRKAASELSKKQSGIEKHQSVQKRRLKKFKDDVAPPPPSSIQIPFHPPMNYDMMSNMDQTLASMGADIRSDRANTSFPGPLDSTLPTPSAASALHSTLNAGASDMAYNLSSYLPYAQDILTGRRDFSGEAAAAAAVGMPFDWGMLYSSAAGGGTSGLMGLNGSDDPTLLQSVQRRQLLVGAAKKQQEAMAMLRQSSEMTRLAQASGSSQVQIPGSSMGGYGAFSDMAHQERMAVYAAAGAQSMGNRVGLSCSIPSPFDPQTMKTSHLASSPLSSFLTPAASGPQLPRMTDSDHGYLRSKDITGDGSGRESLSKNLSDKSN